MILSRNILSVIMLFLIIESSYSQNVIVFSTPGAGSWVVPCGVTHITIEIYGGGGGGGGSNSTTIGGGGGGGGEFASNSWFVTPGEIITYTIGAGGAGGGPAGNGANGGQTNLAPWAGMSAFGGSGGLCENLGGGAGAGGTGGAPIFGPVAGGNGTNGVDPTGGQGGTCFGPNGGGGGAGGGAGVSGGTGGNYGGGGGGGGKKGGGVNTSGGSGANGAVIITYNSTVTMPNAGPNVSTCNVVLLSGNTPDAGWTGTWNIISGTPIIANINDPNSLITIPMPGTCAVVEWEFTLPGCPTQADQVQICYPLLCNDDPCGAIPLVVNSGSCSYSVYSNNAATASVTPVEPGCGSWSDNDAWYSAVVPASGVITVSSTDQAGGVGMIMGMSVYSEGPGGCNDMVEQGCDNATSAADVAEITYTGTPGETIYVRVWDFFENESNYQICAFTPAVAAGNILPGSNTVTCGSTMTFFDPGGGANYQPNTTAYYVLCPDTPGQSVTVDFSTGSFATEFGHDFLTVLDGAADSSYIIGQYSGTGAANNPGVITSSAPDGCLTLIFASDNSIQNSGWSASVYCSVPPATPNNTFCSGTDCPGECGTWICQSGLYPTENIGNNYEDMNNADGGCFDNVGEVASQWFYFTALTNGTVELSFAGPGGQDYNFAIYAGSTNGVPPCPQNTQLGPVACSQADVGNYLTNGLTGLSSIFGGGESFEGAEGDGWIDPLQITAGETYAMVVNIYQNGGPQPIIDLTIGGTGTLDCTPVFLPIELHSFTGMNQGDVNVLNWITSSELNNDYFTIERSVNGFDWELVDYVDGAGTSYHARLYTLTDETPFFPVTYYRLSQTDFDGAKKRHNVIAINSEKTFEGDLVSNLFPNPSDSYATFVYNSHDSETPLVVSIINEVGASVLEVEYMNLYKGMPMTLRTTELATGMYHVVFSQGKERDVQKFSVIR